MPFYNILCSMQWDFYDELLAGFKKMKKSEIFIYNKPKYQRSGSLSEG